jgi:hypothetical protein
VAYLSQIFKFDKSDFDALAGGALNFILACVSGEEGEALKQGNFEAVFGSHLESR